MENLFERPVVASIGTERYKCTVKWRNGEFIADEPQKTGGKDSGPDPMTLMLASLGTCTLATLRMYIDRKGWAIPEITIALNTQHVLKGGKNITVMTRDIHFLTTIPDEQKERLLQIAKVCPVSKMLETGVQIKTGVTQSLFL